MSLLSLAMLVIGLLCAMSQTPPQALLDGNAIFTDYKGALTEQYVQQQLRLNHENCIYYWSADNSQGESSKRQQNPPHRG